MLLPLWPRTVDPDPPSDSESFLLDATTDPLFSIAHEPGEVCANVLLTKSAEDGSVLVEGIFEATESNSNLHPLGQPVSFVVPLSVSCRHSLLFRSVSRSLLLRGTRLVPWRSTLLVVIKSSVRFLLSLPVRQSFPILLVVSLFCLSD